MIADDGDGDDDDDDDGVVDDMYSKWKNLVFEYNIFWFKVTNFG